MQPHGDSTSTGAALESRAGAAVSEEEAHRELERVLHSAAFQRSERLQRFLRFVCEYMLRGEGARLHEYLIGAEVFGRGPKYSPHEDGIVRRQAHALRRKLQEYYEHEGATAAIRIELPVGRYVPAFRRVEDEVEVNLDAGPKPSVAKPGWWLGVVLVGVALFLAGWVVGSQAGSKAIALEAAVPAEVREIWGTWLDDPGGAVVCFSNPLTTVIKHFQVPLPPDSKPPRMRLTVEQEKFFRSVVSLPPGGHVYFAPAISQAKMGEAIAAVHLSTLFAGLRKPIRATQSRFLSWEDLTRENVILLGHNEANPWLDRVLETYPFKLSATVGDRQRSIVNTQPAAGEKKEYQISYAEGAVTATEEYALISMIPGVDGNHRLLLINGLNTQATQIAAEFLTTPGRLRELQAELRKRAPQHRGRWYFQMVLRTEVHDKVPTTAYLAALRVVQPR